ncbi:MAG TPA: 50S ribosomal protein L24 [Candidatus Paceibacterota bacterium]
MNSNHTKRNKTKDRFFARNARPIAMKMKLKKGDQVMAVSGKDKGKTGTITRVMPKTGKIIVDGLGMTKRHRRPTAAGQTGRIVDFSRPMHASNFMLVDPKGKKPTRVKRVLKDGKLVRVAHKSGTTLA